MLLEDRLVLAEGEPAGGPVEGGTGAADVDHQVVAGEALPLLDGVGAAVDRDLGVARPRAAEHVNQVDVALAGRPATRDGRGGGAGGGVGRPRPARGDP